MESTGTRTYTVPDGQRMYVVTIKSERRPEHDPRNKRTGTCRCSVECSDVTGQHHSYVTSGVSVAAVTESAKEEWGHVTRVEEMTIWPE